LVSTIEPFRHQFFIDALISFIASFLPILALHIIKSVPQDWSNKEPTIMAKKELKNP
jgi:hypothetical protein